MITDGNMIMSGFVSKVINDCGDILKSKIRSADKNRKSSEQNMETRIYQVTIDAINIFTFDTCKDRDILYDAAERILKGFKGEKENIEAVKAGLKMLESQITDGICEGFLRILRHEICKNENDILYKEIVLLQQEQMDEEMRKGFRESTQRQNDVIEMLSDVREDTKYIREKLYNEKFYGEEQHSEIQVENRAEEYAEKWDKNVFLNDFRKRDKNAGVNIKLKDIYLDEQLPHYTWKTDDEPSDDLKELLKEYIVDIRDKNMLLILGQPGIGKSTLITWIMANFREKKDDLFVYQFASDLKDVNWQSDNILNAILEKLNLRYAELEGKVLILDGFDEIYVSSDGERILNKLNRELAGRNILKNFSLVIMCRENYICELRAVECDFIILQTWDDKQIKSFCENYGGINKSNVSQNSLNKILENKEVFGVPLILYMVLALDITIENSESLVDVYDQIFSPDRSSIYDRCIENSRYGEEHRIGETKIKRRIHQISQRIAFWIFENNSEKAFITQKEYEDICDTVISETSDKNRDTKKDFLIGNYFKLINYCDGVGTKELHFIHRSIYEYFVVVYFFESVHNLTSKEEVAGKLGELLKDGNLSGQILQFIKYKFDKIKKYDLSDITREVFRIMLRDGMMYHMKGKYKNIVIREMRIFANMLEVVHLWNPEIGELDHKIVSRLRYNKLDNLNLTGIKLRKANLSGVYLRCANLAGADLSGADLRDANLVGANLEGADLRDVRSRGASLRGANLIKANLSGADLSFASLINAKLLMANFDSASLMFANFNSADLTCTNFNSANLMLADLCLAQLISANLEKADLNAANLMLANLEEANLRGASLSVANLYRARLKEAVLDEKQAMEICKKYDLSRSRVYLSGTDEIVSYEDYLARSSTKQV